MFTVKLLLLFFNSPQKHQVIFYLGAQIKVIGSPKICRPWFCTQIYISESIMICVFVFILSLLFFPFKSFLFFL